jgi:hypothetical protein
MKGSHCQKAQFSALFGAVMEDCKTSKILYQMIDDYTSHVAKVPQKQLELNLNMPSISCFIQVRTVLQRHGKISHTDMKSARHLRSITSLQKELPMSIMSSSINTAPDNAMRVVCVIMDYDMPLWAVGYVCCNP